MVKNPGKLIPLWPRPDSGRKSFYIARIRLGHRLSSDHISKAGSLPPSGHIHPDIFKQVNCFFLLKLEIVPFDGPTSGTKIVFGTFTGEDICRVL